MDELDLNLLNAWDRVFARCKADPKEARKRYERTLPGTCLDRPARAWCVALRASDTRLAEGLTGEPGGSAEGMSLGLKRWMGGGPLPDEAAAARMSAQMAHEIVVDGTMLRHVGGPVWIDEPGLPLDEAAALLGKDYGSLRRWLPVKIGRTVAEKEASTRGVGFGERRWAVFRADETGRGVLNVRYVPAGAAGRKKGMEVPVVWSDGPLDPSGPMGRPPVNWWGSSWQSLAEKIPAGFEQVLERVPRFLPYQGGLRFRGWWWRCPGLGEPGCVSPAGCGRLVSMLYAPLPVWTLGKHVDLQEGLNIEGLSGRWLPGVMDRWAGRRRLACRHCWRVRNGGAAERHGWNEFVTHLSGGLLYGREVKRPEGFGYERRRAYVKRRRKTTNQHGALMQQSEALPAG
ncbi:MAG: hypothetical protein AAGB26_00725 [Planctomycetota bacterium]